MKMWITKYWSSRGIYEQEAEVRVFDDGTRYAAVQSPYLFARIGTDAFESYGDAVARVRTLANLKLASLDRQKAKIRKTLGELR